MKKLLVCFVMILLCGCSVPTSFEAVEDVIPSADLSAAQEIQITFPDDAVVETMESPAGTCYLCDEYTVSVQVLPGGNLEESLQALTGLTKDALTLMKTRSGELQRYDTVWTAVSESGDQTCRLTLLDDGGYHYGVTVMADAAIAGKLTGKWNALLESVQLVSTG